ncbi:aldo/keto reductase [Staphylococcus pseudintermedius]|nr:aldo/keto reductase [Staphylococcus pseudintermedius]EGQ3925759.1 aldo/keto reductase [Staphylococcus pseudintermedius]EGQ3932935.1 aldo/keto reductase [Staphylococcus pseudintermedius]EHA6108632.1 aldo/keto reductase [Staphylococcus pseudintermedius]EKH2239775.1 aldo/keto reductase [Staphylococcus pseudintermedius]
MQKNVLKSGIELSELGLGCMSLGTEENKAEEIIDAAVTAGITYFDTADIYDQGVNEKIVGRTLKKYQNRDDIVIGTKVGNHLKENGETFWDPSKRYIKGNVKNSLQRLGLDTLDLYMLHGGTIDDPLDETISAFDELKQEGVIRAYGLSSIRPNVIRYYLQYSQIETLMTQFNLIDNRPIDLLDEVQDKGVKLLARGPVFKGLLAPSAEKVLTTKFAEGIFDYDHHALKETVTALQQMNPELTGLAFNYLKSFDVLGSIIVGASSVEQLQQNVTHYHQEVNPAHLEQASDIVKHLHYAQHWEMPNS